MTKSTQDYEMFKKHLSNTPIDTLNLKKLINSIKMKNMLELRPIVVNKHMEIIDGQHRLEAAKQLGVPIFYIMDEEAEDVDMILLNSAQRKWRLEDYIHFYAAQGNSCYKKLEDLAIKHQIPVRHALSILGIYNGQDFAKIKNGIFDRDINALESSFKDKIVLIKQTSEYIKEKTMGNKKYTETINFKKGLSYLINNTMFSFEIFMKKLETNISRVHSCTTARQYFEMFKNIYNFRNSEPIE